MTIDFEQQYLAVRKQENRFYSDYEVSRLPEIFYLHDYADEWKVRKRSATRLIAHLEKKNRPLKILEIGCGNGWLSSRISNIKDSDVTGVDINMEELNQARRVFCKENLRFVYGEFNLEMFKESKFDCIVFAASLQYFPSIKQVISDCLHLLTTEGNVHILDTYFYTEEEQDQAAGRTIEYYNSIGFSAMADSYYHHTYEELRMFNYRIASNPLEIMSSLIRRQKHFHWIIIKP